MTIAAMVLPAALVFAAFTPSNGQAATLVLGQVDFASAASACSQSGLTNPFAVVVDPTSGKVFVADVGNHRVLRYASVTELTNGAAAEGVLGQADFTSCNADQGGSVGANTLDDLRDLTVDAEGRLWVTDYGNNRVLRYDNAASKADGADADGVLGQPNFTSTTAATTQNGMRYPGGIFVDREGRAWIADLFNHRVLRFDDGAAKANGAAADGVLGQTDFTSNSANQGGSAAAGTMNNPNGVFGRHRPFVGG